MWKAGRMPDELQRADGVGDPEDLGGAGQLPGLNATASGLLGELVEVQSPRVAELVSRPVVVL